MRVLSRGRQEFIKRAVDYVITSALLTYVNMTHKPTPPPMEFSVCALNHPQLNTAHPQYYTSCRAFTEGTS